MMALTTRYFSVLAMFAICSSAGAQFYSAVEAISESERTGKPIFSISTSPTCPPCRALKHTVQTDPQIRGLLEDFVVLEMQSSSADFGTFMQRYPGEYFGVPMVHVVSGAGQVLYARSGNLPSQTLQQLLGYAMTQSTPRSQSTMIAKSETDHAVTLEVVREAASKGDLTLALEQVIPIAALGEISREVVVARAYREQLESAVVEWINQLQKDVSEAKSTHSATYRLAKLFTELPQRSTSRSRAMDLMRQLEGQSSTRVAMLQAKRLVRARLEEERKLCSEAIRSYEEVVRLDASSPSGQYAIDRIPVVREREQLKLTSHSS